MMRRQVDLPGESCATCGLTSVGVSSAEADMVGFKVSIQKVSEQGIVFRDKGR